MVWSRGVTPAAVIRNSTFPAETAGRKVNQLQSFITAEFFCSHCAHINCLFPHDAAVSY
jgi:hypothetical protein